MINKNKTKLNSFNKISKPPRNQPWCPVPLLIVFRENPGFVIWLPPFFRNESHWAFRPRMMWSFSSQMVFSLALDKPWWTDGRRCGAVQGQYSRCDVFAIFHKEMFGFFCVFFRWDFVCVQEMYSYSRVVWYNLESTCHDSNRTSSLHWANVHASILPI